jgi:hypothetical protein
MHFSTITGPPYVASSASCVPAACRSDSQAVPSRGLWLREPSGCWARRETATAANYCRICSISWSRPFLTHISDLNAERSGHHPMGDATSGPVRLSFNPQLRVEFRGSTVTSDAGLLLPRESDEHLGLSALIERHLTDPRMGRNLLASGVVVVKLIDRWSVPSAKGGPRRPAKASATSGSAGIYSGPGDGAACQLLRASSR